MADLSEPTLFDMKPGRRVMTGADSLVFPAGDMSSPSAGTPGRPAGAGRAANDGTRASIPLDVTVCPAPLRPEQPQRGTTPVIRIDIALTHEHSGYLIAVITRSDPYHMGSSLVVGQVRDRTADEQPAGFPRKNAPDWKAWLWPEAGGNLHVTRSCEAVEARSVEALGAKIRKRLAADGPWWREVSQ